MQDLGVEVRLCPATVVAFPPDGQNEPCCSDNSTLLDIP
jgi:hypothetical protein